MASQSFHEELNAHRGGFNLLIGLTFVLATTERVEATVPVSAGLSQPYGLVHGGVYSAIVETVCSAGAALFALEHERTAVGLDNHTSFLRAARGGVLRAVATPVRRGRRTQVWEAMVTDESGEALAKGTVRLLCLKQDANVGGQTLGLTPDASQGTD